MMLWREVSNDMFKLWYLAESDLLREGSYYQLTNTGQGLNRVQAAPRVGRAMRKILAGVQVSSSPPAPLPNQVAGTHRNWWGPFHIDVPLR